MENDKQNLLDAAAGLIGTAKIDVPADTTVKPSDQVVSPVVVDSPFGKQVFGGKPIEEVNLTSFADVKAFAKDYLGAEIKEVKDFVPLFAELKQTKEQAASAAQLQKTVDNFTSTIENLPKEVSLILDAAIKGGDYKAVINTLQKKSVVDYEKPFESQDSLRLINHYTGKQYTKETFDALDPASKDVLTDSVKLKFDADRSEVLNFETNTRKALDEKQNKFLTSIDVSIAAMLQANPKMDKAVVADIKKTMQFGLSSELFTKDQTYTPEAAEKIAMMKFGKQAIVAQTQTIGDLVKKLTNEGISKDKEKLLLRSDKLPVESGKGDQNLIASIVQRETSWLPLKRK
jgi:hypothetical protein